MRWLSYALAPPRPTPPPPKPSRDEMHRDSALDDAQQATRENEQQMDKLKPTPCECEDGDDCEGDA